MSTITTEQVKELRELTGVSVMQCRKALEEAGGDLEKAQMVLRKISKAQADKKLDREFGAFCSAAYIHQGGKVGAMVQLACETDFVAQNPEFAALAQDIAVHIAGMGPLYIKESDISEADREKHMAFFRDEAEKTGKTGDMLEKIAEGKYNEYVKGLVLLNQPFLKDGSKTIQDLLSSAVQKFGENTSITQMARFS
jgi:elongation factor Ts